MALGSLVFALENHPDRVWFLRAVIGQLWYGRSHLTPRHMKTRSTTRNGLGWLVKMALMVGIAVPQWSAAQEDAWNQLQDLPGIPRQQAVAFTIAGNGYVVTGTDPGVRSDLFVYNFATDTWTRKHPLTSI